MRILLVNGPNLNTLGKREPDVYGRTTLADIEARIREHAAAHNCEIAAFQSNHEGAMIDFLQQNAATADGVIINPGAFTHTSYALRDAIAAAALPAIEVHISNIYERESFRHVSVTAPACLGLIAGLGWRGYILALEGLVRILKENAG